MLYDRFAANLNTSQLNSVTLAVSHLIEQQYAQKLSDEEFSDLEKTFHSVYQRGRDSASTVWGTHISSSVFLKNYELTKKNPAIATNLFIDELLKLTAKVDENLMPAIFVPLTKEEKEDIGAKICQMITGNTNLIARKDELRILAEKLLGTEEVKFRLEP
jgi:hypothetical protein